MTRTEVPTDGPDAALSRVVARLRLPYSRSFVARAVAGHARPQSLLALVEVARSIGLKATPAEVDPSALAELDLPLIAHFNGSESGGFGVVEKVSPEGYTVWDSTHGSRVIEPGEFLRHWSRIVALLERDASGAVKEKGLRRNRLIERVFGRIEPPAVTASRSAGLVRSALGVMVVALLGLAVVAAPSGDRLAAAAVTFLSVAGFAVATLAAVSISSQDNALSDRICARGKLVDCHSVLTSKYSRVFGIPLSDVGVAYYASVLLLIATGAVTSAAPGVWAVAGVAYVGTLPAAAILIGVQISMRQLCTLCLAVHVVNAGAATCALLWLRPGTWPARETAAYGLLLVLFFCIALFFAIPYFKKSQGLQILGAMRRRIAGSPFASLAEILTEEPRGVRGGEYAVPVGGPAGGHELVVFVHPSCNRCTTALEEVQGLLQSGLVRIAIGLVPKDPDESDRRACAAVVACGIALGPDHVHPAYAAAKKNLRAVMTEDPVRILSTELSVPADAIENALDEGRRRVDRAEAVVDAHAEGTPAIFFDGRLYRGPLTHLAFLLANHPDLLDATRVDRVPASGEVEAAPSS
jgi:uncharacterized membrane protein